MKISDQLRVAINTTGETRYRLALASGIHQSILSRFVRGERHLDGASIDKLAAYLELDLCPRRKRGAARTVSGTHKGK